MSSYLEKVQADFDAKLQPYIFDATVRDELTEEIVGLVRSSYKNGRRDALKAK